MTLCISRPLLGTILAAVLTMGGCQSARSTADPSSAVVKSETVLDLKRGEVLQFALVAPRAGEEAQAVRRRYFRTAIPFAESLGDRSLGTFKVSQTMVGDTRPVAMAVYAFPDEAAQQAFQASPDWDDYQRMRREGWDELHVLSTTLERDMVLRFDPTKEYTLAAAWTRPGTMADYQRYLDGIEPDFDQIGARYVAQFRGIDMQSQTDPADDPSQITIVEWSNGADLNALSSTQGYKDNAASFRKAISRFDLHVFKAP